MSGFYSFYLFLAPNRRLLIIIEWMNYSLQTSLPGVIIPSCWTPNQNNDMNTVLRAHGFYVLSCSRQITGFIMALKKMNQVEGLFIKSLTGETNSERVTCLNPNGSRPALLLPMVIWNYVSLIYALPRTWHGNTLVPWWLACFMDGTPYPQNTEDTSSNHLLSIFKL